MEIALCGHEFRHLLQNGELLQALEANRRQGVWQIWKTCSVQWLWRYCVAICVIFGQNLRSSLLSKNVFWTNRLRCDRPM